jgi:hypothetical protein
MQRSGRVCFGGCYRALRRGLSFPQRDSVRDREREISSPSTFDLVLLPAEANFYGVAINLGPTYLDLAQYATQNNMNDACPER